MALVIGVVPSIVANHLDYTVHGMMNGFNYNGYVNAAQVASQHMANVAPQNMPQTIPSNTDIIDIRTVYKKESL